VVARAVAKVVAVSAAATASHNLHGLKPRWALPAHLFFC
jgi:hypothetical protein